MPDFQFLYQMNPYTLQVVKTLAISLLVIKDFAPWNTYRSDTWVQDSGREQSEKAWKVKSDLLHD